LISPDGTPTICGMNTSTGWDRGLLMVLVLAVMVVGPLVRGSADEPLPFSAREWVQDTGAHKIAGAVTLGLGATTAVLAAMDSPLHPYFGYSTATMSCVTLSLGAVGYGDRARQIWPHLLMNSLATTGFLLNAFQVLEGGSAQHITSGIASLTLMSAAVLYIALQ
jgi:hypothetical protein